MESPELNVKPTHGVVGYVLEIIKTLTGFKSYRMRKQHLEFGFV